MHSKDYPSSLKEEQIYIKSKRIISSSNNVEEKINGKYVLNFCTNNYLGLSPEKDILREAQEIIKSRNANTQTHSPISYENCTPKKLEQKISDFLRVEDTILYATIFGSNGGIFEPLFSEKDAIICNKSHHVSIVDVLKLEKSSNFYYKNNDLKDLETKLKEASLNNYRFKFIITEGVCPMNGTIADLRGICNLAKKYDALVMVDDSHATGLIGKTGRGSHEFNEVWDKVDVIISTFGMKLGSTSAGFTSGKKEIIDLLRQHSQPYLFSNSLDPIIIKIVSEVLDILSENTFLLKKISENVDYFRTEIKEAGFDIIEGNTPIIPIMLYDTQLAQQFADKLMQEGIYVVSFFNPVVPKGKARIRVQISAAHTQNHLDKAINAFVKIGKELAVI